MRQATFNNKDGVLLTVEVGDLVLFDGGDFGQVEALTLLDGAVWFRLDHGVERPAREVLIRWQEENDEDVTGKA